MRIRIVRALVVVCLSSLIHPASSLSQPPLIHYQGRLVDGTNLVNDTVSLAFRIYTNDVGGAHLFEATNLVTVVDGLYATVIGEHVTTGTLDAALEHAPVWLEVEVDGAALSPRERILAVPYARRVHGLRVGSDASVTHNPDQNNVASGIASAIGGGSDNMASGLAATIAGGGDNIASGDSSTVGGGLVNIASGWYATVPGGTLNQASGQHSFAAGRRAKATNDGAFVWADSTDADFPSATNNEFAVRATGGLRLVGGSFSGNGSGLTGIPGGAVSGGDLDVERIKVGQAHLLTGTHSSIAGGENNTVAGNGSFVGGGWFNSVSGNVAVVSGGNLNLAHGTWSAVGGGFQNAASANFSTVPGGEANAASGQHSLAAGRRAKATHNGAFVWADSTDADFTSSSVNEFAVRAANGLRLVGGSFIGNGAGLTNLTSETDPVWNAEKGDYYTTVETDTLLDDKADADSVWLLGGNTATTAGTHFVGTTDDVALELHVNTQRALRIEPHATSPRIIGGHSANTASGVGATIAGGGASGSPHTASGDYAAIGGGRTNTASGIDSTVGGGWNNIASGIQSTIGGGFGNTASGNNSTIGGGLNNTASGSPSTIGGGFGSTASGEHSTVGGGFDNTASGSHSAVGGGSGNVATNQYSTVSGGRLNRATKNNATVGGGRGNIAGGLSSTVSGGTNNVASGDQAAIGGGADNVATTDYATVGGGLENLAHGYASTVGGGEGNVADGGNATVPGGLNNSAAGQNSFAAGSRAKATHLGSFVWSDFSGADVNSSAANEVTFRASGGFRIFSNSLMTTGVVLAANSGAWTSISDVNAKEAFDTVDTAEVLEKVARMPITTWRYRGQDHEIRHMGPTAQDFHAAFGLGDLPGTGITTVDADGVAFAAIQALKRENEALRAELEAIKKHLGM